MAASGPSTAWFRLAAFILLGITADNVLREYNRSRKLEGIFDVIPNGHKFQIGLQFTGQGAAALLAYSFLALYMCIWTWGVALCYLGLIDFVFTIFLIAGVALQAEFIPTSHGACDSASDWRNGTDGRNFFVAADASGRFNDRAGNSSPEAICHSFVQYWFIALGASVIFSCISFWGIFLGLLEHSRGRAFEWREIYKPTKAFHLISYYLFTHHVPTVRFIKRYASKFMARWRVNRTSRNTKVIYNKSPATVGDSKTLPAVVVDRIAQQLHYVDLVNLSRSSKSLRTMFFGHGDPEAELDRIRQVSCQGKKKSQCRMCDRQVCEACQTKIRIPYSYATQHIDQCRPVCTKCFHKKYCHKKAHWGNCKLLGEKQDVEKGLGVTANLHEETLCRLCAKIDKSAMKRVEVQDVSEMRRLAKLPLVCQTCKDLLPSRGPQWWICNPCGVECRSEAHLPWMSR
ncbi:hypothetical protein FDECE_15010 [Fusarium decemcellulare]|nr:hypothetical protein FDECE_15010 [Fusarium decemcellulare]